MQILSGGWFDVSYYIWHILPLGFYIYLQSDPISSNFRIGECLDICLHFE